MIRAVVFDLGETLVDETRQWSAWADWLGVPRFTFLGVLGAVIAHGEHHRRVFELVAPGRDAAAEQRRRVEAGADYRIEARDFYPDALPALAACRAAGMKVGIAGNQPEAAEAALRAMGLPLDLLASSVRWGVEKPDPRFFACIVEELDLPAGAIAYVGDRLDNDVLPAKAAGMAVLLLRRGPWGFLHAAMPDAVRADALLDDLGELPHLLARL